MKTRAKSQAFLPASPLTARGEDEGEGFQTGAKLNLQTLTLPSPLERERRIKAQMQVRGVKPDP
jgi:hypothetical protein